MTLASTARDFILSLAAERLYRPLWSEQILDEVEYNEAAKLVSRGVHAEAAAEHAARLRATMMEFFDDACVLDCGRLQGSFGLPDGDDEHVLAAAVLGGAGAIVTDNVRDFPRENVPPGIEILRPHQFVADTVAVSPGDAVTALLSMQARRQGQSVNDILTILRERYKMGEAVTMLIGAMET